MGNIITAIVFLVFAYLQLNDPDPILWVLAYSYISVLAGLKFFNKLNKYFIWFGYFIYIVGLGIFLPDIIDWISMGMPSITGKMKAESPYVEFAREFFGLFICLTACMVYDRKMRKV